MAASPLDKQTASCKSPHKLAGDVEHGWAIYFMFYVDLKMASFDTIWLFLVLSRIYIGYVSEMASNSASYLLNSWPISRPWISTELWQIDSITYSH